MEAKGNVELKKLKQRCKPNHNKGARGKEREKPSLRHRHTPPALPTKIATGWELDWLGNKERVVGTDRLESSPKVSGNQGQAQE